MQSIQSTGHGAYSHAEHTDHTGHASHHTDHAAPPSDRTPVPVVAPVATSVGVEDCARFSRRFVSLLDMEDILLRGSYHLEVSSPGLERKLRTPAHFLDVIGKEIFVSLKDSLSVDSPFSQSMKGGDNSL